MRRPGNIGGTDYWFGSYDRAGKIKKSLVDDKLAEILGAKIKNHTPLTEAQKRMRLSDVLKGMKPKNITG